MGKNTKEVKKYKKIQKKPKEKKQLTLPKLVPSPVEKGGGIVVTEMILSYEVHSYRRETI